MILAAEMCQSVSSWGHSGQLASITLAVLVEQCNDVSDLSCVGGCGFELNEELETIALSLASSAAKRSSSFCICSSLCSIAYRYTFKSSGYSQSIP